MELTIYICDRCDRQHDAVREPVVVCPLCGGECREHPYAGIRLQYPVALRHENRLPPLDREQQRMLNEMAEGRRDPDSFSLPG